MYAGFHQANDEMIGFDAAPDEAGACESTGSAAPSDAADAQVRTVALAQARSMLQFVRVSRELFPGMRDLADHPGWEILLHLFIAPREGRTLSTAQLCSITGCWRPLVNRYVELMFERGLVDREVTPDRTEDWPLQLTADSENRLLQLLSGFASGWSHQAATPAD